MDSKFILLDLNSYISMGKFIKANRKIRKQFEGTFQKGGIHMVKNYIKKYTNPLVVREIKSTK
jgi:hypothetical protein